jgi:hypothetical protein
LFLLVLGTATAEPPFSEETFSPAFHCGTGAARQSAAVSGMVEAMLPGAQAPVIHMAYRPLPMDCHHSLVHPGAGSTSLRPMREVHRSATFLAPGSWRPTETEVASFCWKGRLPACQSRLSRPPASPGSMEAMKRVGSDALIFTAAASNSAQVFGGSMPSWSSSFLL